MTETNYTAMAIQAIRDEALDAYREEIDRITRQRDEARRTSRALAGHLRCFDYTDDGLRAATGLDPLPQWLTTDATTPPAADGQTSDH